MLKKALALSLILSACVDQVDQDLEIESTERLAGNALMPGYFVTAQLNPARLTSTTLKQMASTPSGRAVLPYVIGCALSAGTTVSTTYNLVQPISFAGDLGLAPSWQTTALTLAQQRLVSACVLARVNAYGNTVTISLRGPSAQLYLKTGEFTGYPNYEGTYFGNVFAGTDQRFAACGGTATTLPDGRVCATEETTGVTFCGFEYAGACSTACAELIDVGTHTYYQNCTVSGVTFTEGVTTYVQ
jgi:hypothetical protein